MNPTIRLPGFDDPLTNAEFWRQTFAMVDSLAVERLVIDIRDNGGGNNFFNRPVSRGIVARPEYSGSAAR